MAQKNGRLKRSTLVTITLVSTLVCWSDDIGFSRKVVLLCRLVRRGAGYFFCFSNKFWWWIVQGNHMSANLCNYLIFLSAVYKSSALLDTRGIGLWSQTELYCANTRNRRQAFSRGLCDR